MMMTHEHTLRDGMVLPAVGFGTAGMHGANGVRAITSAIRRGYRLLDTAYNYENEGTVGEAIRQSGVPREDILVSSKLPGRYHEYDKAIPMIQESLYRAGLDYFDLYLIHWPNPHVGHYVEAWQALVDAQKFGLIRSIGVSNFLPEHLEKLRQETGVLPVVDQLEIHPRFSQSKQRRYNNEHGIVTEAWSPLGGQGFQVKEMLELPQVVRLAERYGKSAGQIILRWETQLGVLPLPLSHNAARQQENLDIFDFELEQSDVEALTALDIADGRVSGGDPRTHEEM
jgi:diketogulonate reductase-like aldo/keto reductase